jgi:hypothetical protein
LHRYASVLITMKAGTEHLHDKLEGIKHEVGGCTSCIQLRPKAWKRMVSTLGTYKVIS